MKKSFISILIGQLILNVSLLSAQTNADTLLKKIQSRLDGINDLSMEFKQSSGGKVTLKGKVFFKKEDKLRFELDNSLIISDGAISWNYSRVKNEVIIVENDASSNYLSIRKIVYDYPEMCKLSSEIDEGNDILVLTPEESDLSFNSAKLFINKDSLIFRAVIDDPAAGLIQLEFSNHKTNSNLPDSDFLFTPPEGSKVIDLR